MLAQYTHSQTIASVEDGQYSQTLMKPLERLALVSR
jgi:hypothetical protein